MLPFGVNTIARGRSPTLMGRPGRLVAVDIGVTEFETMLATYSVLPSGLIAIPSGPSPTLMGRPAVPVATVMGVTDPAVSGC